MPKFSLKNWAFGMAGTIIVGLLVTTLQEVRSAPQEIKIIAEQITQCKASISTSETRFTRHEEANQRETSEIIKKIDDQNKLITDIYKILIERRK